MNFRHFGAFGQNEQYAYHDEEMSHPFLECSHILIYYTIRTADFECKTPFRERR